MKNVFKVLGIIALVAVIGFSTTSCKEDTGGGLTITGLNEYNGKYAYALAGQGGVYRIYAATKIDLNDYKITYGKIRGGSVNLNVYRVRSDNSFNKYGASDELTFSVYIYNDENGYEKVAEGRVTVQFDKGDGEGPFILK